MRVLSVQQSGVVDNLWGVEGGEVVEGVQQPYPLHVTEGGEVLRQDFWKGDPARVIGFAARVDVRSIDLYWSDAWTEPERAVGMYPVTADAEGGWATLTVAVEAVTPQEVSE